MSTGEGMTALLMIPLFLVGAVPVITVGVLLLRDHRVGLPTAGLFMLAVFAAGSFAASWFDAQFSFGSFVASLVISALLTAFLIGVMAHGRRARTSE